MILMKIHAGLEALLLLNWYAVYVYFFFFCLFITFLKFIKICDISVRVPWSWFLKEQRRNLFPFLHWLSSLILLHSKFKIGRDECIGSIVVGLFLFFLLDTSHTNLHVAHNSSLFIKLLNQARATNQGSFNKGTELRQIQLGLVRVGLWMPLTIFNALFDLLGYVW